MFGIFDSVFGWVFGTLFYFGLGRVEDVVSWLLPIYMTVQCLRKNEAKKFNNYLSFWCLASLLFGVDYLSGHILHNILIFRVLRVIFLIWIFIDNAHNSVYLVDKFLTPVIDEHLESIDNAFNAINKTVDNYSEKFTDQAKVKIGSFVQASQTEIMTGVLNFASTASKSVTSIISNAEPADSSNDSSEKSDENSNNNDSSSSNDKTNEGAGLPTEASVTAATTDDSKEVEK